MADNRYNISQVFQLAFGINSPIYVASDFQASKKHSPLYGGVEELPKEEAGRMSALGTPVVFPLRFEKGDYQRYSANGDLETITKADYDLPWACLVDFSRAKNITKTRVLGDNGTVKEVFGFDDWRIRMRGVCLADSKRGRTAREEMQELLDWEKLVDRIRVDGIPFEDREIRGITIESIDTPQIMGHPNTLPFTLTAVSDEILELDL